jgi:flagellar hook protein FlgE
LNVANQDGSAPGVLNSFNISDSGMISGVFSNGISQNLGQIQLARFTNPAGLEQMGQNMYATGVNSGLPIIANPGSSGNGTIVAGSLELSNTDVGASLIDLITTSTAYQANTRIITTATQLFDNLLQLGR